MKTLPNKRNTELLTQESANELLIYDLRKNTALCLNETAKLIWKHCDGKTEATNLIEKYNLTKEILEIGLFELQNKDLLADRIQSSLPLDKKRRREFFIKAGKMTIVALPIIGTIVAPPASHAQSCVGAGTFPPGFPIVAAIPREPAPSCPIRCITPFTAPNGSAPMACCSGSASLTMTELTPTACLCSGVCD